MMIGWTNQRKWKGMQKKVGKRKMSILLISIMNQNIPNSSFIITSNYSFLSASNGQVVTSCLVGGCQQGNRKRQDDTVQNMARLTQKQTECKLPETESDRGGRLSLAVQPVYKSNTKGGVQS